MSSESSIYPIEIKNVSDNKTVIYQMKLKDKHLQNGKNLTRQSILEIIKSQFNQCQQDYISIMYKDNDLWVFMPQNFILDLQALLNIDPTKSVLRTQKKLKLKFKHQDPDLNQQNQQIQKIIKEIYISNKQIQDKRKLNSKQNTQLKMDIFLIAQIDKFNQRNQFNQRKVLTFLKEVQKSKKNVSLNFQILTEQSQLKQRLKTNIFYISCCLEINEQKEVLFENGEQSKILNFDKLLNNQRIEKADLLILHGKQPLKLIEMLGCKAKNLILFNQNEKNINKCSQFFLKIFLRQLFQTHCIEVACKRSIEQTKDYINGKVDDMIKFKFSNDPEDKFILIQQGDIQCEFDQNLQKLVCQIQSQWNQ